MARPSEYDKETAAVYALLDPRTSEPRYVGWSKSPRKRLNGHCRASSVRRDKSHKGRWVASLAADGIKPEMILLEECPQDWREAEQFWIAYLTSLGARLTNIQPGGDIAAIKVAMRSPRAKKGGSWGKLQRARNILRRYPEKLARVESAIKAMACRLGISQAEAEAYMESRMSDRRLCSVKSQELSE